ncbi:capsid maturation protease [Arthrobacter phage Mufasa8]|uniref:Capsid maturation protease n=1 Tax=Arthrobacter phage Mufasa8 TaxID=2656526 RepID=A0A649VMP1_9CAUD|nr:head maturation protease [Arthrobacter phage Mufasa8]QGJ93454.1 capsid maturation protease [Arthrobacter phage Mufasa8]
MAKPEERYVLGVAYPANRPDGHGDYMVPETVEKAAWGYYQTGDVGLQHRDGTIGHATVVESYIYRGPDWKQRGADGSEQIIKSGDWLLGAILDEPTWEAVKKGDFTGWSIQGAGVRLRNQSKEVTA